MITEGNYPAGASANVKRNQEKIQDIFCKGGELFISMSREVGEVKKQD